MIYSCNGAWKRIISLKTQVLLCGFHLCNIYICNIYGRQIWICLIFQASHLCLKTHRWLLQQLQLWFYNEGCMHAVCVAESSGIKCLATNTWPCTKELQSVIYVTVYWAVKVILRDTSKTYMVSATIPIDQD